MYVPVHYKNKVFNAIITLSLLFHRHLLDASQYVNMNF